MAGVLGGMNPRTQHVGQNRLELLLFHLGTEQTYGINVFKVKEVLQCPKLTLIPKRNRIVRGVAHIRGGTIPIMDLELATSNNELDDIDDCYVIITEYNMTTQGFLVRSVEKIVNLYWEDVHPPPQGSGKDNYLSAVTEVDNRLVEIIDVEKVLAKILPQFEKIDESVLDDEALAEASAHRILVVDDSSIARKQVKRCVDAIGCETVIFNNAKQALQNLEELVAQGIEPSEHYLLMICDVEMPEMDGYSLTEVIRDKPEFAKLYILLHTSLSGKFNASMVKKVGADSFLSKFTPDGLAKCIIDRIKFKRNSG